MTFATTEIENHSVGSSWSTRYTCENKTIDSGAQWTVPLDMAKALNIDICLTEQDKFPDVGHGSLTVTLQDGYETATCITVTKDKGIHRGNNALWEVSCKVKLVKKLELDSVS